MITLDYSQVAISNLHQQLKGSDILEADLLRHMILNSIRRINGNFKARYGRMVICADNGNYWRKSQFALYKANRKRDREESGIDWKLVFEILKTLKEELKETFPYKVMDVSGAEADDIIGVLAKNYHDKEPILIASADHDFRQLQVYPNVEQYNPIRDEFVVTEDPVRFLKEHIMRGDKGDGIPNFLSDDRVIVDGVRQKPVFNAKVDEWLLQEPEMFCDETMLRNYRRNEKLIDLSKIPSDLETAILEEFKVSIEGSRNKIYSYLVKHRMKQLMDKANEF